METASSICRRLKGVRPIRGGWQARCPAHDDQTASLSISQAGDKLLLFCHAGCKYADILRAIGVQSGPPPRHVSAPVPEQARLSSEKLSALWAHWSMHTTIMQVYELAQALGVMEESLQIIGAAWAWPHDAWAFPMHNASGEMRGIRLRAMDGKKWSVPGGHEGLFTGPRMDDPFCIVEGPTDLAALVSLGIAGVGRPSCQGAVAETVEFCRDIAPVIISDADGPGLTGARELQRAIPGARIVMLPAKDTREFLRNGGTREMMLACIASAG